MREKGGEQEKALNSTVVRVEVVVMVCVSGMVALVGLTSVESVSVDVGGGGAWRGVGVASVWDKDERLCSEGATAVAVD